MALVSIVLPTHNRASYLKEAIESVLAQTYRDWELIIIDDGSTDDTKAAAQVYVQQDARVRYLWQANQGVSAARNAGIRMAQGRYIAFLDSDDVWFPEKLAKQMEVFAQRPDVGLVSSAMQVIDEQSRVCGIKPKVAKYDRSGRVERYAWVTSSVVVRRECLPDDQPFDPSQEILEDHDLFVRLCRLFPEVFLTEPTGSYRVHSTNSVADNLKVQRGYVKYYTKVLREYPLSIGERRSAMHEFARRLYLLGKAYYVRAEYRQAVRSFFKTVWLHPAVGRMFCQENDAFRVRAWKVLKPWCVLGATSIRALMGGVRATRSASQPKIRRVLYLETGSGYGGSAQSLYQLLKAMDRSRVAPLVVAYQEGTAIWQIRELGVPVFVVGGPSGRSSGYAQLVLQWGVRELPRTLRMIWLMKRERVDLVHLNNDLYSSMAGILAAVLLELPRVGFLRLTRLPTRLERWFGRRVAVKLVLTREAEAFYRRWWPGDHFECVFDGVELSTPSAIAGRRLRQALGIPAHHAVVGLIARCVPGKGYKEYLQAAQLVQARRQDVTFVILGNGLGGDAAFEEEMRRFAQALDLDGSLVWGGWQADAEAVYGLLDVVLQASSTFPEGLSRIPLEAMAHGRPVIATDIVGNREAVVHKETGLLVPPGDAAALAEAIEKLLQEPALARTYGRAGRTRAETVFSVQAYAKRIEGLYEQLR